MAEGDPTPVSEPLEITPEMLAAPPAPRVPHFESGMRTLPPVSIGLVVLMSAVFVGELVGGALESKEAITAWGAMVRSRLLAGEANRLLTATMLHGGLGHLLGNAAMLIVVGMGCEHAFGLWRTFTLFWLTGVFGWVASAVGSLGPSVGASGAVFGLAGALVAFFSRHGQKVALRDRRVGSVLLLWAAYTIVTGLLDPFIDNLAHAGGFLSGLALGALMRSPLVERMAGR